MSTHDGMNQYRAADVQTQLEPLMPEGYSVSSVPWRYEDGEWLVTIWDDSNDDALVDIFEVFPHFVLVKIGTPRKTIGRVTTIEAIPEAVRGSL